MTTKTVDIAPVTKPPSDNKDSPPEGAEPIRANAILPPPVPSTGNKESDTDVSTSDDKKTDSDDDIGIEPVIFKFAPRVNRVANAKQVDNCNANEDDWANYDYSKKCTGAGKLEWMIHVSKEWYISNYDQSRYEALEVRVRCLNSSRLWKADAHVELKITDRNSNSQITEVDYCFSYDDNSCEKSLGKWTKFVKPENEFVDANGQFNIEAKISFRSLTGVILPRKHNFSSPSRLTDAILVVGGQKLHINKATLALASPFFEKLFFDDNCSSTDIDEYNVEKVAYNHFIVFLNHLYSPNTPITAENIESLLALANRFKTEAITDKAQQFLLQSNDLSVVQKLLMGDKFKLVYVQDWCINKLNSVKKLKSILYTAEYEKLSADMKVDLFERVMKE